MFHFVVAVGRADGDGCRPGHTGVGRRNPASLARYSSELADAVERVLDAGELPLVLGGDCTILLGNLPASRRRGRYGLLFLDGHADFYQPEAEPNGEAASMDLALVTGRGPGIVTDLEGRRPLVADADTVAVGRRDQIEAAEYGSRRIEDTAIETIDLRAVRAIGAAAAVERALTRLAAPELDGFWIHLDVDVLDDRIMPAVDYRMDGGLSWDELEMLLEGAMASGAVVGMDIHLQSRPGSRRHDRPDTRGCHRRRPPGRVGCSWA